MQSRRRRICNVHRFLQAAHHSPLRVELHIPGRYSRGEADGLLCGPLCFGMGSSGGGMGRRDALGGLLCFGRKPCGDCASITA
jgi:hypothetical protein